MKHFRVAGLAATFSVALVLLILDQLSKSWAESNLLAGSCTQAEDACIDLFAGIKFHLIYNTGAAFSQGESAGQIFAVLALIMTVVLLGFGSVQNSKPKSAIYGLMAGGAFGNFSDRAFRSDDGFLAGGVVDFIDFGWWPIFNIADAAIVLGVLALVVLSVREDYFSDTTSKVSGEVVVDS